MRRIATSLVIALALAAACSPERSAAPVPSLSVGNDALNAGSGERFTLAVIGDTPYGPEKLAEFPSLVSLINSDPKVELVAHVGDIKAGSNSPCTDAYFSYVRTLFDGFKDPLVYTPGDNEWTDCHLGKKNGLYTPTERLQAVRALFFPVAGQTLGGRKKRIVTQADDPANSAYVENTLWIDGQVLFAALNVPGSNNDRASWGALPADAGNYPSQAEEQVTRAQANRAWLDEAFAIAQENEARGVVLLLQADMWDTTAALSGYDDLVTQIGNLSIAFGKPVLLLEGDSHIFRVDNPYDPASVFHGTHPSTPIAGNVTRIVVEGSAAGRTEYLRLTVDPKHKKGPLFSYERVPLH
jgi:hypothetical protein